MDASRDLETYTMRVRACARAQLVDEFIIIFIYNYNYTFYYTLL